MHTSRHIAWFYFSFKHGVQSITNVCLLSKRVAILRSLSVCLSVVCLSRSTYVSKLRSGGEGGPDRRLPVSVCLRFTVCLSYWLSVLLSFSSVCLALLSGISVCLSVCLSVLSVFPLLCTVFHVWLVIVSAFFVAPLFLVFRDRHFLVNNFSWNLCSCAMCLSVIASYIILNNYLLRTLQIYIALLLKFPFPCSPLLVINVKYW